METDMLKKILVVTDFSPNSLKATIPALTLATEFEGTIFLCHVDEEELALSAHSSDELVTFLENIETRRSSWLESMANEIREEGVDCEIVRLRGWASREIIEFAQAEGMDLVVISALGGEGFKTLLMGSTSANVLRGTESPLLFVGANCTPHEDFAVKSVLFPTDFSENSLRGAKYAARFCQAVGASLEILHVMKIPSAIPAMPGEAPLVMPPGLLKRMDDRFEEMVAGLTGIIPEERLSCEVASGDDEAEKICAIGVAKKMDLIIIPRRGHGVLTDLMFGRVAENVARLASVPTLVIAPEQGDD